MPAGLRLRGATGAKKKTDARGETSPSLAADSDLAAERRDAIETLAESTVDAFASDVPMSFRDEIRGGTRARGVGLEGPEEGRSGRDPEGVAEPPTSLAAKLAEPPTSLAAKLASLKDEFASLYETVVAEPKSDEKASSNDSKASSSALDPPAAARTGGPPLEVSDDARLEDLEASDLARLDDLEETRRRYDALLGVLASERRRREKAEQLAIDCASDATERLVAADAEVASANALAASWRARVKAMEAGCEYAELFARYERDVDALERECERLRGECVESEIYYATRDAPTPAWAGRGFKRSEAREGTSEAREGTSEARERTRGVLQDREVHEDDRGRDENERENRPGGGDSATKREKIPPVVGPDAAASLVLASRDVQRRLDRLTRALRRSEASGRDARLECENLRKRERLFETQRRVSDDASRASRRGGARRDRGRSGARTRSRSPRPGHISRRRRRQRRRRG